MTKFSGVPERERLCFQAKVPGFTTDLEIRVSRNSDSEAEFRAEALVRSGLFGVSKQLFFGQSIWRIGTDSWSLFSYAESVFGKRRQWSGEIEASSWIVDPISAIYLFRRFEPWKVPFSTVPVFNGRKIYELSVAMHGNSLENILALGGTRNLIEIALRRTGSEATSHKDIIVSLDRETGIPGRLSTHIPLLGMVRFELQEIREQ